MGTAALDTLRRELAGEHPPEGGRAMLHSDEAFRRLLSCIVTLEYEPGELLTERQIAADLQLTREPLRRAVTLLSALGLVEPLARKGIRVAGINALDVSTVYDARLAIETQAARFAAIRSARHEAKVLWEHSAPDAEGDGGGEEPQNAMARRFLEHDQALHLAIAALGRNPFLEDALTRLLPASARLWHWVYRELGPDTQMMFSHDDLVEAVTAGDPDRAQEAVEAHLAQSQRVLTEVLTSRIQGGRR
ncbi:GntR family transcriptional regulator [Egibacter rhizosphaerae]|uniref:GntR family transcriptional regulator n=1 Tax=Egibacter rhizosphaerae TaxID=1670831 RepID=A0A411YF89_9ACTN|nr:GntR family transcriptional regulator [Egibacter rhizosphaerae]QBI19782.1 GntR family transcriptional regulator [Egibacter rhizosphaerae]